MCPAILGAAGNYARRKAISRPEKDDDSKGERGNRSSRAKLLINVTNEANTMGLRWSSAMYLALYDGGECLLIPELIWVLRG